MSKNKTENAIIKYLILSCLSQKSLRCDKVRKLKCSFPDGSLAGKRYVTPVILVLGTETYVPQFKEYYELLQSANVSSTTSFLRPPKRQKTQGLLRQADSDDSDSDDIST